MIPTRFKKKLVHTIYMYYCMTGRIIQVNILLEIDCISPTEGKDDTEVKNRILPRIARPKELQ